MVKYKDIVYDGKSSTKIRSNGEDIWLQNHEELSVQLNKLSASGGRDTEESALDGLGLALEHITRSEVEQFVLLITDAGYKADNNREIESLLDAGQSKAFRRTTGRFGCGFGL